MTLGASEAFSTIAVAGVLAGFEPEHRIPEFEVVFALKNIEWSAATQTGREPKRDNKVGFFLVRPTDRIGSLTQRNRRGTL